MPQEMAIRSRPQIVGYLCARFTIVHSTSLIFTTHSFKQQLHSQYCTDCVTKICRKHRKIQGFRQCKCLRNLCIVASAVDVLNECVVNYNCSNVHHVNLAQRYLTVLPSRANGHVPGQIRYYVSHTPLCQAIGDQNFWKPFRKQLLQ